MPEAGEGFDFYFVARGCSACLCGKKAVEKLIKIMVFITKPSTRSAD
jgi:hypothetical protein